MIVRKIYQEPEVAKCDLCKKITATQFRFDFMLRDDNNEFIYASQKMCRECAIKFSEEINLDPILDEYILHEEQLV